MARGHSDCRLALLLTALLGLPAGAGICRPAENGRIGSWESARTHFTPAGATLSLSYDVSYRLFFLTLAHIADATVSTTEGAWTPAGSTNAVSAALLEVRIDTRDGRDGRRQGRLRMHNLVGIALSLPRLEPIVYVKSCDEEIKPLIGSAVVSRYDECYDFQTSVPRYLRADCVAGTVDTNVPFASDGSWPGREIPTILTMAASLYGGRVVATNVAPQEVPRVSVTIDGKATPFTVAAARRLTSLCWQSRPVPALRLDIGPAPEANGRGRPVAVWVTTMRDLAGENRDGDLDRAVACAPAWSIVPLEATYGMAIGAVDVGLDKVAVTNTLPRVSTNASATAGRASRGDGLRRAPL